MALDLTIAIPVRNEEHNLPTCLTAIGKNLARHIVVIDSGSTDRTKEIAERFGAEVIQFEWNGKFPKKRNWFLRNYPLNTRWVLFLDADEYLSENFKEELSKSLAKEDKAGYWLSYSVYFLGGMLKGGYPLRKLALFKVGAGEYECINEDCWSQLDMEVHEHPIITGELGIIRSKIDHQDFRGISSFISKHDEYASWEAERFLDGKDGLRTSFQLTRAQRLKYRLMQSIWIGPVFFFGSFFLLGGIRDGARGFAYAVLKTAYYMQVYCKIQEKKHRLIKDSCSVGREEKPKALSKRLSSHNLPLKSKDGKGLFNSKKIRLRY